MADGSRGAIGGMGMGGGGSGNSASRSRPGMGMNGAVRPAGGSGGSGMRSLGDGRERSGGLGGSGMLALGDGMCWSGGGANAAGDVGESNSYDVGGWYRNWAGLGTGLRGGGTWTKTSQS